MTTEVKGESAPKPTIWAKGFGLIWTAIALLTVFTYWQGPLFLNLASSFRVQLLLALSLATLPVLFLFPGKRRLLFLGVPAVIAFTNLSYYIPLENPPGQEIRVTMANIYSGNRDLSVLRAWLEKHPADVLGILEVAPHHLPLLEEFGYDFVLAESATSYFGIALLSKTTPLNYQVLERESPFPSILAVYEDYQVIVTHPVPPLTKQTRLVGDEQLMRLSEFVKASEKPTIFMGDFNATDWDRRCEPLKEAGLRNTRQGFGILPTWPTHRPLMLIPIDHIYIPEPWGVTECEVGPNIGSDHYPIRSTVIKPG